MKLPILYLWLIGHFLADFYFQSNEMAEQKNSDKQVLFKHNIIYMLTILACTLIVFDGFILLVTGFIGIIHALIDQVIVSLRKKYPQKTIQLYLIDQAVHLLIILVSFLLFQERMDLRFVWEIGISLQEFLKWIVLLIIIIQPISITIRIILEPYRPEPTEKEGVENAGALVGILERLIVFLLLSVNQYAAIGLVLTAKSIARYNRISEDPVFSEYYLLGTLLSMLLVIAPFLAIF